MSIVHDKALARTFPVSDRARQIAFGSGETETLDDIIRQTRRVFGQVPDWPMYVLPRHRLTQGAQGTSPASVKSKSIYDPVRLSLTDQRTHHDFSINVNSFGPDINDFYFKQYNITDENIVTKKEFLHSIMVGDEPGLSRNGITLFYTHSDSTIEAKSGVFTISEFSKFFHFHEAGHWKWNLSLGKEVLLADDRDAKKLFAMECAADLYSVYSYHSTRNPQLAKDIAAYRAMSALLYPELMSHLTSFALHESLNDDSFLSPTSDRPLSDLIKGLVEDRLEGWDLMNYSINMHIRAINKIKQEYDMFDIEVLDAVINFNDPRFPEVPGVQKISDIMKDFVDIGKYSKNFYDILVHAHNRFIEPHCITSTPVEFSAMMRDEIGATIAFTGSFAAGATAILLKNMRIDAMEELLCWKFKERQETGIVIPAEICNLIEQRIASFEAARQGLHEYWADMRTHVANYADEKGIEMLTNGYDYFLQRGER